MIYFINISLNVILTNPVSIFLRTGHYKNTW